MGELYAALGIAQLQGVDRISQAYVGEASLPGKEAHAPHCGLHLEKPGVLWPWSYSI